MAERLKPALLFDMIDAALPAVGTHQITALLRVR